MRKMLGLVGIALVMVMATVSCGSKPTAHQVRVAETVIEGVTISVKSMIESCDVTLKAADKSSVEVSIDLTADIPSEGKGTIWKCIQGILRRCDEMHPPGSGEDQEWAECVASGLAGCLVFGTMFYIFSD